MNYIINGARFSFFNGKQKFTVEYCYGISKWFVFKGDEQSDAIFVKEDKKIKLKDINSNSAESILLEYLNNKA